MQERVNPSRDLLKVKVLYVEDDPVVRESLAGLIVRYIPNLIVASNGEEALELFRSDKPDIVISDIRMPRMDGLELARQMKILEPEVKIIITSAFSDSAYLLQAIEIGLNGYLIKPINRDYLFRYLNESINQILAQRAKNRFNEYTQQILDFQQNLIAVVDRDLVVKRANKSFLDYFACASLEEFLGRHMTLDSVAFFADTAEPGGEKQEFDITFLRAIVANRQVNPLFVLSDQHETFKRFFTVAATRLSGQSQEAWDDEYIISFTDITALKEQNKSLKKQASTDPLTHVENRLGLQSILNQWHITGDSYSVIFFDIDHFKKINDDFGHNKGDEILVIIASLVRSELRDGDILARIGGEEFVILLSKAPLARSVEIARRLCRVVGSHTFPISRRVTCSFGVAKKLRSEDADSVIKRADQAMYIAKKSGRNRVEVATEDDGDPLSL